MDPGSDHLSDPQDSGQSESPEIKQPGTPTPTIPAIANLSNSNPRRPPRKSTLTQQQKNQKRQRATQDQLITLEHEFNKNPTPTALVRERIAQDINMTERSVQIWFQNRRAKIKNIARKSIENGEDCESIPESMRRHLAMQAMESGKPFFPGMMNAAYAGYGAGGVSMANDASSGKVVIQHFNCRSLSIGTWRRVGQSQMDLIIFYSPEKACITYYINNDSAGYKVEYPFAWCKSISLVQGDMNSAAEGASQQTGSLVVELNRPPKFYMDGSGGGGFYECSDFTEDQQASRVLVHHLGGPTKILSGQLAKLVSLDTWQNRHLLNPSLVISAPVSPVGHRPASQPNHIVHPQQQMFPDVQPGLMGPPAPRGHKRQRSRSVPLAVDFSMLRQPVPPFVIQQAGSQTPAPPSNEAIFAPIPQHSHNFANGPVNPNLSIDTSAQYGMDFRQFAGPMSATTLNSPSEFGTPAFFANPTEPQPYGTPVTSAFLNVDQGAMVGTSNTPLSIGNGDPVIADHSPPFNVRSQSADIFSTPGEHASLTDDPLSLDNSKPLAFKSPLSEYQYNATFSEDFTFSPPSNTRMELPFRAHDQQMPYETPTHAQHQDSGISFTPNAPYHTPKEEAFGSSSMYQSPAHLAENNHQTSSDYQTPATHVNSRFQTPANQTYNSPLPAADETEDQQEQQNMQDFVQYGTIDPAAL